eukprot:359490-Chlamydomonas_euryale.AAC.1
MGYMPRRHPKPSTQCAKCLSLVQGCRLHCYALVAAAWAKCPVAIPSPRFNVPSAFRWCRAAACTATR